MKTLLVVLLGLASSLLPLNCAKASTIKGAEQLVSEKINHHLYFDNDKDAQQLKGRVLVSFVIDEKGKINIIDEQSSDEEFKKFVNNKLSEITFDSVELLLGETYIINILAENNE